MTIYALKPRFQALLRPLVTVLYRGGVTANMVTVGAALGSIAAGAFVAWRAPSRTVFLIVPAWLFARMALNAIDGMLAREFHQKSVLGGYLNEITDVVSDAALYAPFALVAPFGPFGIGAIVCLSIVTELAGALGPMMGASRRYDGPMGKSDRAFVFGVAGPVGWPVTRPAGVARVGSAAPRHPSCHDGDQQGPLGHRRSPHGGAAMLTDAMSGTEPIGRPVEEKTFRTHDGIDLFYRYWPAVRTPARGAIVLFHRGHEHSGRMAHLADELGLPDFAMFAWDARGQGRSPGERGFSPSLGTSVQRRPDIRRTHLVDVRHRARRHRRDRTERRRRAGRHLGARLRAADPLPGAGIACLQGEALRTVRAPGAEGHAEGARTLLRQLVREVAVPDSRSGAHQVVRLGSADRAADRRQHPAGALRNSGTRRRRRPRHHDPHAASDLRRGLRGASRPAAPLLREPWQPDQGTARAPRLLPRHVRRTGSTAGGRQGAGVPPRRVSPRRQTAHRCSNPIGSAIRATKRRRWPRRCRFSRRAACTGPPRG